MNKPQAKMNMNLAVKFSEEIEMMASSLCEDVKDSSSMTEAWKKIDRFYQDVEGMRNYQKCTGNKSFSVMQEDITEGHTKYLQGISVPIMVNTIWESEQECRPSNVCEMHIGMVDGRNVLLITPEELSLPDGDSVAGAKEFQQRVKKKLMQIDGNIKEDDLYFSQTMSGYYMEYKPNYPDKSNGDFIVCQDLNGSISVYGNMDALVPTSNHYEDIAVFEKRL